MRSCARVIATVLGRINRSTLGLETIVLPELDEPALFPLRQLATLPISTRCSARRSFPWRCLRSPARILDLGAYVGYAAVYLAHRFPEAEIVCVEPAAPNFKVLTLNTVALSARSPAQRRRVEQAGHACRLRPRAGRLGGPLRGRPRATPGRRPGRSTRSCDRVVGTAPISSNATSRAASARSSPTARRAGTRTRCASRSRPTTNGSRAASRRSKPASTRRNSTAAIAASCRSSPAASHPANATRRRA